MQRCYTEKGENIMQDIDMKILNLLKKGTTLKELMEKTVMYPSEIAVKLNNLENKGYEIHRLFNENGVKFQLLEQLKPVSYQDNLWIKFGTKMTFLVIADTHFGNADENLELVEQGYQYAIKNDIKYIFHLGDLIEGVSLANSNNDRVIRTNIHDQIDFITKYYPKSDTVNTLYILGNHDYRALKNECIDIAKVITKRRPDMHFLGYQNSKIRLGNRVILLQHPFTIEREEKYDKAINETYDDTRFDLVFRGHTHHNNIYFNSFGSIVVNVPACYTTTIRPYTSAYEATIKDSDTISNVELTNLVLSNFSSSPIPLSVNRYSLKKKL